MTFIPNSFDSLLASLIPTSGGIQSGSANTSPSPSKAAQVRHKGVNPFTEMGNGSESMACAIVRMDQISPYCWATCWAKGADDRNVGAGRSVRRLGCALVVKTDEVQAS